LLLQMAALERRFGVASLAASFAPELCEIYDCYLSSVLPVGDAQLECVRGEPAPGRLR